MKISIFFRYIMNKETYITPACPKCGSEVTGRVITVGMNSNVDRLKKNYLKAGEYIKPRLYLSNYGDCNAFCLHCGNEWNEDNIKIVYPTKKELQKIKEKKKIIYDVNDEYLSDLRDAYINNLSYQEYIEIKKTEEAYDDECLERSKSLKIEKLKRNVKRATVFFWKKIIVSSTVGVMEDIFPGKHNTKVR